jgi:hypothetical protein
VNRRLGAEQVIHLSVMVKSHHQQLTLARVCFVSNTGAWATKTRDDWPRCGMPADSFQPSRNLATPFFGGAWPDERFRHLNHCGEHRWGRIRRWIEDLQDRWECTTLIDEGGCDTDCGIGDVIVCDGE